MTNLRTAIALEAVYQARPSGSSTTRPQFAQSLKWAYRVQSTARSVRPFMREVDAGCYANWFSQAKA